MTTSNRSPVSLSFLVPGFSKCGTTTLCALLAEHPRLYIPLREPWFFSRERLDGWRQYESHFGSAPEGALLGEGSTSYSSVTSERVARERILHLFPGIKLIFIARDPMARIESSYREFHDRGEKFGVNCPFDLGEALVAVPQLIEDTNYWQRIANYRPYVTEDQILVIFLEDLVADPLSVLARCFEFLGVDATVDVKEPRRQLNPSSRKRHDTPRLRELYNEVFNSETAAALREIPPDLRESLLTALGLRKHFAEGPLEWPQPAVDRVADSLEEDIIRFLTAYGKDLAFWPRFASAVAGRGGRRTFSSNA